MQTILFVEIIIPFIVITPVALQIIVWCLVAEEYFRCHGQWVFTQFETAIDMAINLKLTKFVSYQTHIAIKSVVYVFASIFIQCSSDIGIVGPTIFEGDIRWQTDAIWINRKQGEMSLCFIHCIYSSTEL